MPIDSIRELFVHELLDMYDAEHQLVNALEEMSDESTNEEVKQAFSEHLEVTRNQVKRLEEAISLLDQDTQKQSCQGISGLIKEKKEFSNQEPSTEITDIYNIEAGKKAEHYEIQSYESMLDLADRMPGELNDRIPELIRENLDEERDALQKLNEISSNMEISSDEELEQ